LNVSENATPARQALIYGLLVLGCCFLASRLAVIIHELLGHMAAAALLGAELELVEVRPVGGGVSIYSYPPGTSPVVVLTSTAAGLVANLATGVAAMVLSRSLRRPALWALYLSIFAGRSVVGVLTYLALGLYYGVGDPGQLRAALVDGSGAPWDSPWPWVLPAALVPFGSYALTRVYAAQQERWLPARGPLTRVLYGGLTLGLSVAIVFGAPRLLNEKLTVSYDGARLAAERGVPVPFPLLPVVALVACLGAAVALWRRPTRVESQREVKLAEAGAVLLGALLLASLLALAPVWRC
jgi:hypothetical protein